MKTRNLVERNSWNPWANYLELEAFAKKQPWLVEQFGTQDGPLSHEPNILILLHRHSTKKPNWAFGKNISELLNNLQKPTSERKAKKRLYIDTCYWTHLADVDAGCGHRLGPGQSIYKALHQKILHLHKSEKLICPLSLPLLIEVYAQSDSRLRLRKARFMETLSDNYAILLSDSVEAWEASDHNQSGINQVPPPLTTIGWQTMGRPVLLWLLSKSQAKWNLRWPTIMRLIWNTWTAPFSELSNLAAIQTVRTVLLDMKVRTENLYSQRKNAGYLEKNLAERMMSQFQSQTPNLYQMLSSGAVKPEKIPAFIIHALLAAGTQTTHSHQIKLNDITDIIHMNQGLASCDLVWCDKKFYEQMDKRGILALLPKNRKVVGCPHALLQILEEME